MKELVLSNPSWTKGPIQITTTEAVDQINDYLMEGIEINDVIAIVVCNVFLKLQYEGEKDNKHYFKGI